MASRVTNLDRVIAKRIRELREQAKFTQPHVAGHLGITYQSYQKMERGDHCFRASTVNRLAQLYGITISDIMGDGDLGIDPTLCAGLRLLQSVNPEDRGRAIIALRKIKHGNSPQ